MSEPPAERRWCGAGRRPSAAQRRAGDQGRHSPGARLKHSVATQVRRSAAAALLALAALLAPPMLGVGGIAYAQTQVLPTWSLTPQGLDADDKFRLLFVGSTTPDGSLILIGLATEHPKSNKIFVIRTGDELIVKRLI